MKIMHKRAGAGDGMRMPLLLLTLLLVPGFTPAAAGQAQDSQNMNKWSVSTSLTYPIVRIYGLHFNYLLNEQTELFFGPCYQNYRHDSFTAHAYTLILGYRRFMWKQFFAEAELYPAYHPIYSHVTDRHYKGVELWTELKVGYRLLLPGGNVYLQPSPGIGFGIFRTNKPPNFGDEIETPIFIPQLQIGLRL